MQTIWRGWGNCIPQLPLQATNLMENLEKILLKNIFPFIYHILSSVLYCMCVLYIYCTYIMILNFRRIYLQFIVFYAFPVPTFFLTGMKTGSLFWESSSANSFLFRWATRLPTCEKIARNRTATAESVPHAYHNREGFGTSLRFVVPDHP